MKIYLSGPIMFDDDPVSWREQVKDRFRDHKNIELLDPLRRDFRDDEILSTNEIVKFDLQDVEDADIILVNYTKPSVGTSMEVREAYIKGKFIIGFTNLPKEKWSPWMIYHCTRIVEGLDKALNYIEEHWKNV